MLHNPNKILLP